MRNSELQMVFFLYFFQKNIICLFSLFCQHSETIIFGITQPEQNKPQN